MDEAIKVSGYFYKVLEKLYKDFGKPQCIGLFIDESGKSLKLCFNTKEEYIKNFTNYSKMEHHDFGVFSSDTQINYNMIWGIFRELTISFDLPTVFYFEEHTGNNNKILSSELEMIGKWIVKSLRDDIFERHLEIKHQIIPLRDKNTENRNSKEISVQEFFGSLNREQLNFLDKYLLLLIDENAFNFGRFIDEEICYDNPIQLMVNGKSCLEINPDLIGNGNYSGEYFDWVPRFSKYGDINFEL